IDGTATYEHLDQIWLDRWPPVRSAGSLHLSPVQFEFLDPLTPAIGSRRAAHRPATPSSLVAGLRLGRSCAMTQTADAAPGTVREQAPARPRSRWTDDLVTAVLSGWVITGMVLDAWAHQNASRLETFFTPWHAVLYSGFAAVAAWMISKALAARRSRPFRTGVPVGYGLGLVGVAIFFLSGIGDGIWHTIFGIERNLEAALSPTHVG